MSQKNPQESQELSTTEQKVYAAVKETLEQRGDLQEIRAKIQKKVFDAIRGDNFPKVSTPRISARDPRIQLVNQLIMQYFHWYGYMYSIEMFGLESESDTACPVPNFLENQLSGRQYKSNVLPILVEIVMDCMEKKENIQH